MSDDDAAPATRADASGLGIRRLRWWDVPAVAALDSAVFGADAWTAEFYWAALAAPGQSFVVIDADPGPDAGADDPGARAGIDTAGSDTGRGSGPARPGDPAAPDPADTVLGFAGLGVSGPQADVLTLASHPRARGRGIGQALLGHLLGSARAAGCEAIHLDVRSDNHVALGLYTAHGFTEIGRRTGYYTGADAVVMRAFL